MKRVSKCYSIFLFIMVLNTSCHNYYNDTIKWMDSLDSGTSIQTVKENQPDYVIVDWANGIESENDEVRYAVLEIKGNNDILNMSHYLIFIENKFNGRFSSK
ncbi:hypothetical protein JBL43_04300 [Aureibaculum sp. A20]|uniref:Uncharacterized protein n=1 Tax=Aureibaculum flavum TaxID=2795986 RepID=A0ABS0WN88_9FLAO|nr:hypothetical protein [Aureibaculum flavum]MBJ2173443.1 hypothetical protein [Aureibaculum flavum]